MNINSASNIAWLQNGVNCWSSKAYLSFNVNFKYIYFANFLTNFFPLYAKKEWYWQMMMFLFIIDLSYLPPIYKVVVDWRSDNAIHRINLYPVGNAIHFAITYQLDRDLFIYLFCVG